MRRVLPGVLAMAGFGLLLAGVIVFNLTDQAPPDFGWSSYAPLAPVTDGAYQSALTFTYDDGWAVTWTRGHLLGAGLVVLGLLVMVGLGGWWFGRRTSRTRAA